MTSMPQFERDMFRKLLVGLIRDQRVNHRAQLLSLCHIHVSGRFLPSFLRYISIFSLGFMTARSWAIAHP